MEAKRYRGMCNQAREAKVKKEKEFYQARKPKQRDATVRYLLTFVVKQSICSAPLSGPTFGYLSVIL